MTERRSDVLEKTQKMLADSRAVRERQLARRAIVQMALDPSQPKRGQLHLVFDVPAATRH